MTWEKKVKNIALAATYEIENRGLQTEKPVK